MPASTFQSGKSSRRTELPPLPRQRRARTFVLGMVVVVAGALGTGYLVIGWSERESVVVMARDVAVGSQIGAADVGTTRVSAGTGMTMIPGSQLREVVGRIASVDLKRGALVVPAQLTTAISPAQGQQVIPVGLKPSQVPARGLRPGDQVLVVPVPSGQGTDPKEALPDEVPATVDRVGEPDADSVVVVDLVVSSSTGPRVAQQSALGRVVLVITSRRR